MPFLRRTKINGKNTFGAWYFGDVVTPPSITDVVCTPQTVRKVAAVLWAKAPSRQMMWRDANFYYPDNYDELLEDSFTQWAREHRKIAEDYIYEADEAIRVVMKQMQREGINVY